MSAVAYPEPEGPSREELLAEVARLGQINQNLADQVIHMMDKVAASKGELMAHGYDHAVEVNLVKNPQPNPWTQQQLVPVDVESVAKEVSEEQELFARLAAEMGEGEAA